MSTRPHAVVAEVAADINQVSQATGEVKVGGDQVKIQCHGSFRSLRKTQPAGQPV